MDRLDDPGYLLLARLSVATGVVALVWQGITALATTWVAASAFGTGAVDVAIGRLPFLPHPGRLAPGRRIAAG